MEKFLNATERKRSVVTGGTEGIGRVITEQLLKEGHEVVICARTKSRIDQMKIDFPEIHAYDIDLSNPELTTKLVASGIEDMSGIDLLILNAGVTGLKETQEYTFRVNEQANQTLIRESLASLRENEGTIVFLTSGTAHTELGGGIENYRTSKLNMENWLKEISQQQENQGLKIFSVNPGSVNTRMHKEVLKYGTADIKERTKKMLEENRLRDQTVIGKIISKMALSGNKFNPETRSYDIPIQRGEVVEITDQNIRQEISGSYL